MSKLTIATALLLVPSLGYPRVEFHLSGTLHLCGKSLPQTFGSTIVGSASEGARARGPQEPSGMAPDGRRAPSRTADAGQRKCLRVLKAACRDKKICGRGQDRSLCSYCPEGQRTADVAALCQPQEPPTPAFCREGEEEIRETIDVAVAYQRTPVEWGFGWDCEVRLSLRGVEFFLGACYGPSLMLTMDEERQRYVLPFRAVDISRNNGLRVPSGFGDMRGHLVTSRGLVERSSGGPAEILGLDAVISYQGIEVWAGGASWRPPIDFGSKPAGPNLTLYRGTVVAGDTSVF